jgi:hypothetical protein
MMFDLSILCLIATGLGMFVVSLLQDLLGWVRDRREAARAAPSFPTQEIPCR